MKKSDNLPVFEKFNELRNEFMLNAANAVLGDLGAYVWLGQHILRTPEFIINFLFWQKFSTFISGIYADQEGRRKLSQKFCEEESGTNNAERIIKCIDSLDSNSKTKYIINLTRSFLADCISKNQYFRLINVLSNIIEEDIIFLADNLEKESVADCESADALANLGLMYITGTKNPLLYAFSPLAYSFYDNAIRYDDETSKKIKKPTEMQKKMVPSVKWGDIEERKEPLSKEQIGDIIEDKNNVHVTLNAPNNPKEGDIWIR